MYIIIGQGAAGMSAARTLRRLDQNLALTMITREKDYFYSRIDLPDVIKGKISLADAPLADAGLFADLNIACRMGETVSRILPREKRVELASGETLAYEKLLLATGSVPAIPPIPGLDARGVFSLWTLDDARRILEACATARRAVVIGAGLIGLKTALALKARGLEVTVVEQQSTVMPRQLDRTAAAMIEERLVAEGLHVLVDTGVDAVLVRDGAVGGVRASGHELPCELVVCSVGVRPDIALAREAGLEIGLGIAVDAFQRTSDPFIYAAGDAAESRDCLTGACVIPAIWPVAVEQGRRAAYAMKNRNQPSSSCLAMNAVEIAGLPLISFGDVIGGPGDVTESVHQGGSYRKLVHRGGRLCGVLCLGDIRQAGVLGNMVLQGTPVGTSRPLAPDFTVTDLLPEVGLLG